LLKKTIIYLNVRVYLGAVYKDVRSQGGEGLSNADKGEGVLQMRMSALFGAKILWFFEIYDVSARTRGEGINFLRFCADIFYGRPLTERFNFFEK